MTRGRVRQLQLTDPAVRVWTLENSRHSNWPVVYALNGQTEIYVGETLSARARLRQHLHTPTKQGLVAASVIVDETFNKSVCLDLESYLIRLFAGDGHFAVLNGNAGITDRNYFDRDRYRETFEEVFSELKELGLFQRSVRDIENSDLFKLSPFKALTEDQAMAVVDILEGLFNDLEAGRESTSVIEGDPGTGKTIVGIFLMKLLRDIQDAKDGAPADEFYADSLFAEFFLPNHPSLLQGLRVGLVVPQQSLRTSIRKVFAKTPGLDPSMVLTPFDVGRAEEPYDVLIVDETHRLNQRANQSSGVRNRDFREINTTLFGADSLHYTQLDWVIRQSKHRLFLLDGAQSVRPADLSSQAVERLLSSTDQTYRLRSQLRVRAGGDYVAYVRDVLRGRPIEPKRFPGYDLRFFDDLGAMHQAIRERDAEHGLARLVAGYAWPWATRKDRTAFDIVEGDVRLRWNGTETDWISSPGSLEEVGSIHTVQGYDLNYAGVLIGRDLRYDAATDRIVFDRSSYFDKKGKENNRALGVNYGDDQLLEFVTNIYAVLLTRGMRGTYVYVADPSLRERLRPSLM